MSLETQMLNCPKNKSALYKATKQLNDESKVIKLFFFETFLFLQTETFKFVATSLLIICNQINKIAVTVRGYAMRASGGTLIIIKHEYRS